MADVSTIHVNGQDYSIKDAVAREAAAKQSDWAQTSTTAPDFIKNKPAIDSAMSGTSANAVQNKVIKAYVDGKVTAVMRFQGAKATEAAIKAITSAQKGDVWLNQADGSEWVATKDLTAADASAWEKLGFDIDLSAYAEHGDPVSASGSFTPAGTNTASSVSFGTPAKDSFVKSYPGQSSKLVKSQATKMTGYGTAAQWSASVTNEVLSFSFTPNTVASGTDVDVATGALDANGAGGSVLTGLGTASKGDAVTAMPTATAAAQAFTGTAGTVNVTGAID